MSSVGWTFSTLEPNWWWLLASFGLLGITIGTALAYSRASRPLRLRVRPDDLRITVMKPMSGVDPNIEDNLASFARLKAPEAFQVLLCVESTEDPAWAVARAWAARYPGRFEAVAGRKELLNPKIAILAHAWQFVRNPFVWISDSNVEATQAFMEELVRTWKRANRRKRRITLVHAPLVGVGGKGLPAAFERMHLSSLQNPNHEVSLLFSVNAVVGKTEFFHRDDMEAVGGLEVFGPYLAEDFKTGEVFGQRGKVVCSSIATRNVLGSLSLRAWFNRHTRWGIIRKSLMPGAFFLLEPLINLGLPTVLYVLGLIPPELLLALTVLRMILDAVNYSIHTHSWPKATDVLLVPLKELFLFAAWFKAAVSISVKWRGNKEISIASGSRVVVEEPPPSPPSPQREEHPATAS